MLRELDRLMISSVLSSVFLCALAASPVNAATYYVNDETGNDNWDGLCEEWDGGTCGPKQTIQAGVNAAIDGDTVIVADGVYSGPGNVTTTLFGKAITLRSKNGPANCVIDCMYTDDSAIHLTMGEGKNTVIDGFTVMKCSGC
jgi:hypothetical protein